MELPRTDIIMLGALAPLLCPIEAVKPDPSNPRATVNLELLQSSLEQFGLRKPLVANKRDGLIEAGHQTLKVPYWS